MATLSSIITPGNVETASSTSTLTNKTISGSSNTITNVPLSTAVTGTLPIANGGTGTSSTTFANLSTNVTGTLPVANGGTGAASLTANNVILGNGTSAVQVVAPGSSGNVLTSNGTTWQSTAPAAAGTITAVASGSLSNGAVVVVNSDGTVSAAAQTSVSLGTGTPATLNTGGGFIPSDRICATMVGASTVVVFAQTGSFFAGWIGTISGSTITFGAAQSVYTASAITYASCAYSESINRILVYGYHNSNGEPIVLLLNTSLSLITSALSFGTNYPIGYQTSACINAATGKLFTVHTNTSGAVTYGLVFGRWTITSTTISLDTFTQTSNYTVSSATTLVYDAPSTNLVVGYIDWSNYAALRVIDSSLTVSSAYIARSATCAYPALAYVSPIQKWLYVFRDAGYAGYSLGAIVATVSGSTISYGTAVQLQTSVGGINYINSTYDAAVNGVAITYQQPSGNYYMNYVFATVTGTTPSLASSSTSFLTTDTNIGPVSYNNTAFLYSSSASKSVLIYQKFDSPYTLRGVMVTSPGTVSNVSASNVLGFSNGAYTNGQTATVNVVGSTNSAVSGLTTATKYYVSNDGTLSSTATSQPYAGIALSATKILVKG